MNWDRLVAEHHALVYRVALGILRDPAGAEDVAQEVFVDFLAHPGPLARAENERAFVARTAVNRALKARRGEGRRARREEVAAARQGGSMDPAEAAFRSEVRARVEELPEEQRLAVDLHYYRGFTLAESAGILEIPEGTVSSRISAALARLREVLGAGTEKRPGRIAGFAALLALLETELSACGVEPVPEGLAGRLLRGRSAASSGTPAPARRTAARIGGAVALVAGLFLVVFVAWHLNRGTGTGGSNSAADGAAAGRGSDSRETASNPPSDNPPSGGTVDPPPPVEEEISEYLEGFLGRTPSGVGFVDNSLRPHARQRDVLFVNEDAFAGLPVANRRFEVSSILKPRVPLEEAECAYVALRARPEPGQGSSGAWRVRVVRVLRKEVIGKAWLVPMREARTAMGQLSDILRGEPPGPAKKRALLDARDLVLAGLTRARASREGDPDDLYRRLEEETQAMVLRERLGEFGMAEGVPAAPDRAALAEAFRSADGPAALRAAILARWGEPGLRESFLVFPAPSGKEPGKPACWRISDLCELPADRYTQLLKADRAAGDGLPRGNPEYAMAAARAMLKKLSKPEAPEILEARRREGDAFLARIGLQIADADAVDRQNFVISGGARITAVAAGSETERAGLRPGDLVWEVQERERDGKWGMREDVAGAQGLSLSIGEMKGEGASGVRLRVVRQEGLVEGDFAF